MALLEISDLEVFYGKARSISGVSLSVNEGQIVGIIGPNGAGKSTLLDTILGLTDRSEEHTSELQSRTNLVCRLLLEKKKTKNKIKTTTRNVAG